MENIKVAIVEDDLMLKKQMKEILEDNGYIVYLVNDFQNTIDFINEKKPDIVILDINLPYFDGYYYARLIRKNSNTPILVTSARNSDTDQILSMELGCDDYLIKPFSILLFLTKVNSLVRRVYGEYNKTKALDFKGLILNDDFSLRYDKYTVELTKNEYLIMKLLLEAPNTYVKRDDLLEAIWDDKAFVDDNTLTVNMTRIKAKLEELGLKDVIKTKRGIGYMLSL